MAWIDDDQLYYNGYVVPGVTLEKSGKERQMVSMGAFLVIFPDKVYVNTADLSDYGYLDNEVTTTSDVTFTLSKYDGSDYENVTTSDIAPTSPNNGDYWLNTSDTTHVLHVWSESTETWVPVPTTYVRIEATGIGNGFFVGDGVEMSGITSEGASELNGSHIIQKVETNYIVIIGIIDQSASQTDPMTISRTAPDMDFVIESQNRLWGCKYGIVDGEAINALYACKLGDPKNWNCFAGISTDSYSVNLGSDGEFTGAITYMGYPYFFKENCIHKVYGQMPSNYQTVDTVARGVKKGSHKSLQIVNERLYYQSVVGICAFDGSVPVGISDQLGGVKYINASGGHRGNLYYISMSDVSGNWTMFCYDTERQTFCQESEWSGQNNVGVAFFCDIDADMLMLLNNGQLLSTTGDYSPQSENNQPVSEPNVEWMWETGNIGYSYIDQKYISRLVLRMNIPRGMEARASVQYDSDGIWHDAGTVYGSGIRSTVFPIIPVRCDHMKIRMSGYGDYALYSISYVIEEGSDST